MNKILRKIRKIFYLNQIRPGPRFGRLPDEVRGGLGQAEKLVGGRKDRQTVHSVRLTHLDFIPAAHLEDNTAQETVPLIAGHHR